MSESGLSALPRVGWLNFGGRVNRARFWTRWFALSAAKALCSLLFLRLEEFERGPVVWGILLGVEVLVSLALWTCFAALLTGRFHDAGKSARKLAVAFVLLLAVVMIVPFLFGSSERDGLWMLTWPFIAYLLYLILPAIFSGTREETNAWGPPPPPGYFL